MTFSINSVALEFDMLDADDNKRISSAVSQTLKDAQALTLQKETSDYEGIKELCAVIFKCFNTIFGEGTDKKIFGEKYNLGSALNAFQLLINEKERQESEFTKFTKDLLVKYSPTRVER